MMILKPIEMVTAPNYWSPSDKDYWTITGGVAATIWGILEISDGLGVRAYTPAVGSTLTALFQRGDQIGHVTQNQNPLSISKVATLDTNNRALASIIITAQDATTIIGGTVVFTLTEGAAVKKWTQNWAVKKLNTNAGF